MAESSVVQSISSGWKAQLRGHPGQRRFGLGVGAGGVQQVQLGDVRPRQRTGTLSTQAQPSAKMRSWSGNAATHGRFAIHDQWAASGQHAAHLRRGVQRLAAL